MDHDELLNEIKLVVDTFASAIDGLNQNNSDMDFGSIDFDLMTIINKLETIINNISDSNDKCMLKSAIENIEKIKYNLNDNSDISDKIEILESYEGTVKDIQYKLS